MPVEVICQENQISSKLQFFWAIKMNNIGSQKGLVYIEKTQLPCLSIWSMSSKWLTDCSPSYIMISHGANKIQVIWSQSEATDWVFGKELLSYCCLLGISGECMWVALVVSAVYNAVRL